MGLIVGKIFSGVVGRGVGLSAGDVVREVVGLILSKILLIVVGRRVGALVGSNVGDAEVKQIRKSLIYTRNDVDLLTTIIFYRENLSFMIDISPKLPLPSLTRQAWYFYHPNAPERVPTADCIHIGGKLCN